MARWLQATAPNDGTQIVGDVWDDNSGAGQVTRNIYTSNGWTSLVALAAARADVYSPTIRRLLENALIETRPSSRSSGRDRIR